MTINCEPFEHQILNFIHAKASEFNECYPSMQRLGMKAKKCSFSNVNIIKV